MLLVLVGNVSKKKPEIINVIRSIVDGDAAGNPMFERKWTHQTAEKIATALIDYGIKVSATVVRRLLHQMDYSLKRNKKCLSAGNSSDRDPQFLMIKQLRAEFAKAGDPIISIDTKKKELIGPFKNSGKTWCKKAKHVNDHDFRSEAVGMAAPYGIYDTERNHGLLVVGQSADTSEFAVNCVGTWCRRLGREHYPEAKRILILADGGGSNGSRPRVYEKGIKVSDKQMQTIALNANDILGKWNYTISPKAENVFAESDTNQETSTEIQDSEQILYVEKSINKM